MILFSVGGFTMGMAEETIIFVPIGVAIARAMGFDAVTGTAMITLGAASGFFWRYVKSIYSRCSAIFS